MNKKEIEEMFDKEFWNTWIDVLENPIKSFFFDTMLPEVLKWVDTMEIDVEISLLDTMNDDFKRWFNSCWWAIKKSLSKKYNITL